MVGGIVVTLTLFLIAIALCITINFVVCKYLWGTVPDWVQEIVYIICLTIIMFTLYHLVGHVWGVYEFIGK